MKDIGKRIKKLKKDLPCKVVGATGIISIGFMKDSNKKRENMLKEIKELERKLITQKCPKKSEGKK